MITKKPKSNTRERVQTTIATWVVSGQHPQAMLWTLHSYDKSHNKDDHLCSHILLKVTHFQSIHSFSKIPEGRAHNQATMPMCDYLADGLQESVCQNRERNHPKFGGQIPLQLFLPLFSYSEKKCFHPSPLNLSMFTIILHSKSTVFVQGHSEGTNS